MIFKASRSGRLAHRPSTPACEPLEGRVVPSHVGARAILGTITGQVADASNEQGIKGVKVQLMNAQGKVAQTTYTNAAGNYAFSISRPGPYVVHEVAPRGYVQVTPSTSKSAPVGAYAPGAGGSSWNYSSPNGIPSVGLVGPAYWSDIAPAGLEPFESPINVNMKAINLDNVLKVSYPTSTPADIVNNGHQIQVQYTGTGGNDMIVAGGTAYNLTQFHFHAPAETTVDGKAYSMEEHFVNTSASGATSVVAVFLAIGKHNRSLDPILAAATAGLTQPNTKTTATGPVAFSGLLPSDHTGWFYTGSLTTPPLSQPVNWFVYRTPITLDATQFGEYGLVASQGGFLPNARSVQPLDGRVLNQYDNDVNFTGAGDVGGQSFTLVA